MKSTKQTVLAVLLLSGCAFANHAMAADTSCDPCRMPANWTDFIAFSETTSFPTDSESFSIQGKFDHRLGDAQFEVHGFERGTRKEEKVLLISDKVIALSGDVDDKGHSDEARRLSSLPGLQQLVQILLNAALPAGPGSIKGKADFDFIDSKTEIHIVTSMSDDTMPPPWRLKGSVKVLGPDLVEYDLSLEKPLTGSSTNPISRPLEKMTGTLSISANAGLDDARSLVGWKLFLGRLGKIKYQGQETSHTFVEPMTDSYETVKDLRTYLREEAYPGTLDAKKDFTGFWSPQCNQPVGYKVEHVGTDGMYAVVLCDQRGCRSEDSGRKTFITNDKHYDVISEEQINWIFKYGEKIKFLRCSSTPVQPSMK